MSYKVFLHPNAKEKIEKIGKKDREIGRRIKKKIKSLSDFPEKKGKTLKHSDHFSVRIGKYRVIYEIKQEENRVNVLWAGHREKVYEDFQKFFF